MYHPTMKKAKTVVVVLVCIRFWHCVSSDSCSECQFESCPGETEVSHRALLDVQDHALGLCGSSLLAIGILSVD